MKVSAMLAAALVILPLQTPSPTPAQAPGCGAAIHRQFDFWLGSWDVTSAGKPAGTNRIESAHNGCVLIENWIGAGGGTGMSLNFYDRRTGQWHQTWIGSGGGAVYLNGGLKNGVMVLESPTNRITWTPLPGGDVRQHWETSADQGKTWTTAFDGLYKKK